MLVLWGFSVLERVFLYVFLLSQSAYGCIKVFARRKNERKTHCGQAVPLFLCFFAAALFYMTDPQSCKIPVFKSTRLFDQKEAARTQTFEYIFGSQMLIR